MLIGAISDNHGVLPDHADWPELDLFVHAGDAAPSPSFTESDRDLQRRWLPTFVGWLGAVRAAVKVFVPGNHDLFAEDESPEFPPDVHVLRHGGIDELRLFGSAWTNWDRSVFSPPWAFGADEAFLGERFAEIPDETELLVCHSGVRGVLDNAPGRQVGSESLKRRVDALGALRLFIHGHAHEAEVKQRVRGGALWINAAERMVVFDWSGDPNAVEVRTLWSVDPMRDEASAWRSSP